METVNKIVEKSMELFMQYGLRSISMDDVARTLGISKKTLYQYVDNKADLIQKGMIKHIEEEKMILTEIHHSAENAIDEMIKTSQYVSQTLQKVNPSVIHDLQKYYQSSWELMESLHFQHTYFLIKNNIEKIRFTEKECEKFILTHNMHYKIKNLAKIDKFKLEFRISRNYF